MKVAMVIPDNRDEFRRFDDPDPYFGPAPTALLEGLAGLPQCEVHVVSCTHRPMKAPAKLADNVFFHLIEVPSWGWTRGAFLGCALAVRRKLREIGPDIVHGQGTERYCALAAVLSGLPNVVTLHGIMRRVATLMRARPFSFLWLAARLEALTVPRSGGVICLTNHTRRSVADIASRTWIVPNAVSAAFFDVHSERSPQKALLCVGNVLPWKNQVQLIRALDSVGARGDFRLVFYGKTEGQERYSEEFLELVRTRSWCQHAGNANREELKAALGRAYAVLVPSTEDNCPMVALEAMAAGVPVVVSTAGGLPDLAEEGRTGLFFDPHDSNSICRSVAKILGDETLAREMGQRARTAARARFHPRVVSQQHLDIYEVFLAQGALATPGDVRKTKEAE